MAKLPCGYWGVAILVCLLALSGGYAWPQAATQSIRIIVPFAAGGGADMLARLLADEISRTQKTSAVVENRPGAGTVIATEAVARATPDGNTLLMNANSFVINPILRRLTYDPLASFEPVCNLAGTPMFIVVGPSSPYRTLAEVLDAARASPGALALASLGPATAQHIAFETLKHLAGVDMTFVAYPGNVPALNALLGGHVPLALANYPEIVEHVKAGNLRALATTTATRFELLPDVPTIAELGFPSYAAEVWLGLVAPAKTPQAKLSQITSWLMAALQAPAVKSKLAVLGLLPKNACGKEFADFMRAQVDEYARIVTQAKISGSKN